MKYKSKPNEVEAEQWFPGKDIPGVKLRYGKDPYVTTIQGQQVFIKPGEWIIQEGDGVHAYPCDPEVFKKRYDPID